MFSEFSSEIIISVPAAVQPTTMNLTYPDPTHAAVTINNYPTLPAGHRWYLQLWWAEGNYPIITMNPLQPFQTFDRVAIGAGLPNHNYFVTIRDADSGQYPPVDYYTSDIFAVNPIPPPPEWNINVPAVPGNGLGRWMIFIYEYHSVPYPGTPKANGDGEYFYSRTDTTAAYTLNIWSMFQHTAPGNYVFRCRQAQDAYVGQGRPVWTGYTTFTTP